MSLTAVVATRRLAAVVMLDIDENVQGHSSCLGELQNFETCASVRYGMEGGWGMYVRRPSCLRHKLQK